MKVRVDVVVMLNPYQEVEMNIDEKVARARGWYCADNQYMKPNGVWCKRGSRNSSECYFSFIPSINPAHAMELMKEMGSFGTVILATDGMSDWMCSTYVKGEATEHNAPTMELAVCNAYLEYRRKLST